MDSGFFHRTTEEIMEEIWEKAASYVPEWRLDRENPDIGGALAMVYARIQSGIEEKYQQLPVKFGVDFFNCLNTSMRSSAPAKGYVVFGLADGSPEGTELAAGTALRTSQADDYGERIPVETTEDVCVIPNTLEYVAQYCGRKDFIGVCPGRGEGLLLFAEEGENLQEHCFYMGHPFLLSIQACGQVSLTFYRKKGEVLEEELLQALGDRRQAVFFYETEEGEIPFSRVHVARDRIILEKTTEMAAWEARERWGRNAFWLGCRIKRQENFSKLAFEELLLASECLPMAPDVIYGDGGEAGGERFFPFGERPAVYGQVYFASDEVLGKKEAEVELSFELEFVRVPVETMAEENEIRWKLVMAKEDVRPEQEYEISIGEVVWEYFNGYGWAGLFKSSEYGDCFCVEGGKYRQRKTVRFVCPHDIEPVLVNAREGYYIRARILKMNHAFKTRGFYHSPVISHVSLRYCYENGGLRPWYLCRKNNLEEEFFPSGRCMGEMKPFCPFFGMGDGADGMYLGFGGKPDPGPVRMLFHMEDDFGRKLPALSWEYYGEGGWKELHPADETENFSRTGTVTFSGCPDGRPLRLFQRELYWIRIRDKEEAYEKMEAHPRICRIYMNAARVLTVRTGIEERLTMERYESHMSFRLMNRNIHQLQVWVREDRPGGKEELSRLAETAGLRQVRDEDRRAREAWDEDRRVQQVRDEDGRVRETWVRWQETEQFLYHGPSGRCYHLDANEGILTFGGGRHGAVPAPGVPGGIRVIYSVGGGECCNLLPGQIDGLELSAGFINQVTNPLALSGGYGRENAREAIGRAGRAIRHRFQAATGEDYVSLALEITRDIEKAACFSGVDAEGHRLPGAVTLVLLRKGGFSGQGFSREAKQELYERMEEYLPAGMYGRETFFIREPLIVEIRLMVTAMVAGFEDLFPVRKRIRERLEEFLDPSGGNFNRKGWDIGTLPNRLQLETIIKGVEGIRELKSCVAFARLSSLPGKPEIDFDKGRDYPFVLPASGSHQIHVLVS